MENLKKYKCGGCGCEDFKLYGDERDPSKIYTECQDCESVNIISLASDPRLTIDWTDRATGLITLPNI